MAYKQSPINFGVGTGSSPLKSENVDRSTEGMMDAKEMAASNAPVTKGEGEAAFMPEQGVERVTDEAAETAKEAAKKKKKKRRRKWGRIGKGILTGGISELF